MIYRRQAFSHNNSSRNGSQNRGTSKEKKSSQTSGNMSVNQSNYLLLLIVWRQVCWRRTCATPYGCSQQKLHHHAQLERFQTRWHPSRLGLQRTPSQSMNARLHCQIHHLYWAQNIIQPPKIRMKRMYSVPPWIVFEGVSSVGRSRSKIQVYLHVDQYLKLKKLLSIDSVSVLKSIMPLRDFEGMYVPHIATVRHLCHTVFTPVATLTVPM